MQERLDNKIEQAKILGVSTASVSPAGEVITAVAGVTHSKDPKAVTGTTIFEAASLSKPVFAYIVLKLIERGAFSRPGENPERGLDRPLHELCDYGPPHLPGLREHPNYKLLTARMILSHQAGLPNWFRPDLPRDYAAPAGTRFDYSGLAYDFLMDAVQAVSGQSLQELSQVLFDAEHLNMHNSNFLPDEEDSDKRKDRAIGHYQNGEPDTRDHFSRAYPAVPAASLITTAEDYAKFLTACVRDPFIRQHMFEPQVELVRKDHKAIDAGVSEETLRHIQWGLGIGLQTTKQGETIAFHWGDIETSRSFAAINLDTHQAVTCFTNSANGPLVFRSIAEPVVGDLSPVSQWLSTREKLPLNTTAMYKDSMESIRADALVINNEHEEKSGIKPHF